MANADLVLRVQSTLTARDHRLLGWLYDHGVLTTAQVAHALFPSLDFAQRRLLRLLGLAVITRFRPLKPDGGSYPYHYVIDQLGAEVVAAQRRDKPPRRDHARIRRHHLTSKANLTHLLGLNQFFIDLAGYERTHPGAVLERWWSASRLHDENGIFQHGDHPEVYMTSRNIRPDGHGIWTEGEKTVPFFVEFDTGSEQLGVLLDKVAAYARLTAATRRIWPVLFWLHASARELNLHQRLAAEFTRVGVPVATAARDHATHAGLSPAEAVWWLHGHEGARLPLSALPATRDRHDQQEHQHHEHGKRRHHGADAAHNAAYRAARAEEAS